MEKKNQDFDGSTTKFMSETEKGELEVLCLLSKALYCIMVSCSTNHLVPTQQEQMCHVNVLGYLKTSVYSLKKYILSVPIYGYSFFFF